MDDSRQPCLVFDKVIISGSNANCENAVSRGPEDSFQHPKADVKAAKFLQKVQSLLGLLYTWFM